jgi:DNA-binding GntR family transcriptional regulator
LNLKIKPHKSKLELVYDTLKNAIVSGEWKPGERRNANEIGKILGVSRTPVIEASRLLGLEGLLKVLPQVGLEVTRLTSEEAEEIFYVRGALSGLAAVHACRHLTDKDLAKLEKMAQSMDLCTKDSNSEEFGRLNREFHHHIFRSCNLPHLIMMLERYWNNGNRYARYFGCLPGVMASTARNHHEILKALKERDEMRAKTAAEKNCFEFGIALSNYLKTENIANGEFS